MNEKHIHSLIHSLRSTRPRGNGQWHQQWWPSGECAHIAFDRWRDLCPAPRNFSYKNFAEIFTSLWKKHHFGELGLSFLNHFWPIDSGFLTIIFSSFFFTIARNAQGCQWSPQDRLQFWNTFSGTTFHALSNGIGLVAYHFRSSLSTTVRDRVGRRGRDR